MISLSELSDLYGLFASGIGIGIIFITFFFIIGSMIALLYGVMTRS